MDQYLYIARALIEASYMTVGLTIGAMLVAVVLGLAIALARLWCGRVVNGVLLACVELFRNTPVLVQLFILYFGLAQIGIDMSPVMAAIVGLGLNGAALLSEVFLSSIKSIDAGQNEAGLAIGFIPMRTMQYIILPQAFRTALPSLGNYVIALMKDTSLASAVAAPELAFRARMLVSETYLSTQIYLTVALIYFLLSFPVARGVSHMERKMKMRVNNA